MEANDIGLIAEVTEHVKLGRSRHWQQAQFRRVGQRLLARSSTLENTDMAGLGGVRSCLRFFA
jgi:hypothetical protein